MKQRPLIKQHFAKITKLSEIIPVYKANPELFEYAKALDSHIDDQEALIETMFELIEDLMTQAMPQTDHSGKLDHMCMSTYEFAQRFMIDQKRMDESKFLRK